MNVREGLLQHRRNPEQHQKRPKKDVSDRIPNFLCEPCEEEGNGMRGLTWNQCRPGPV